MSEFSVTILELSDEVLLYILSFVPVLELVLGVSRVCRRLRVLSQDTSLISHVCLHKQYKVRIGRVAELRFEPAVATESAVL